MESSVLLNEVRPLLSNCRKSFEQTAADNDAAEGHVHRKHVDDQSLSACIQKILR